ncbi:ATP-binding protein [Streptomyces sp. WAC05374]|uniref:ATP-binding protein n=1 Tax=Streptomyces sp. WAC05374 TaxID=2487420 RepID=UPI000F87704F|nr:ATP-binding protein [Streptomyces sp. WAC05374]RST16477.1 ATP-binding protein [Streptomyces sp. WAC05374]TDF54677.1 ATP-binding protein [Streptomyces sp. WAC05374]TDF56313.1 ATP-binding protein [Streptomyces sp. WAC05374]
MSESASLREPARPPAFTDRLIGRDAELVELLNHVTKGALPRPRTLVLHGQAGVGKSALASRLAQDVGAALGLPVCWMPLWDRPFDPEATLARLLGRMGAPRQELFERGTQRAGAARTAEPSLTALAQRHFNRHPAVVVLDGLASVEAAAPLLPAFATTRCVVVLTTRQDLSVSGEAAPAKARVHAVTPLAPEDAETLFDTVALGWRRPSAAAAAASELIAAAKGLPRSLRIAVTLLETGAVPRPDEQSPQGLVRLACAQVSSEARQFLSRLESLDTPVFGKAMITRGALRWGASLEPEQRTSALEELLNKGLVHREDKHHYVLVARPGPVPASHVRDEASRSALSRYALDLVQHALLWIDTAEPNQYGPGAVSLLDGQMDQVYALVDRGGAEPGLDAELLRQLARYLTLRGYSHDLFALRGAVSRLGESEQRAIGLHRWLGIAARDVGALNRSQAYFTQREDRPWAELAVLDVHRGLLDRAFASSRRADSGDARTWLTRGVAQLGQGRHWEAANALREAAVRYDTAGNARGRARTRMHQGYLELLCGAPATADELFHQADRVFHKVGDARGAAWVVTGIGRANHLKGDHLAALIALDSAKRRHREAEDLRGEAWTRYYQGLVLADMGDVRKAWELLSVARSMFDRLPDSVGLGWTIHQLAWLKEHVRELPPLASAGLAEAQRRLDGAGCLRGMAWTRLERAACGDRSGARMGLLATARLHFARLDDQAGLIWSTYVHDALMSGDAEEPARLAARRLRELNPLLADRLDVWLDGGGPGTTVRGGTYRALPRWARDIVLRSPDPGPHRAVAPGTTFHGPVLAASECRVRLTLLDGHPARVLLRVVPGPRHPWAGQREELPWLTALAMPLTHAEVQPAGSLLRPSADAARGAEFLLTPHRPGLHRFRFTIADERTGTVLQVVETEIDLSDAGDGPGRAVPFPTHVRRA